MKRGVPSPAANHGIQTIRELEDRSLDRRTPAERISDWLAARAGRMESIVLHVVWYAGWVSWNSIPRLPKFDPFPFPALTAIVSLEAIFLSLFLLASQNRSSRRADERAHLDLQINLLAERESTKLLQMLRAVCRHLDLPEAADSEVAELATRTDARALADEVQSQLTPENSATSGPSPNNRWRDRG